MKKRNFLLALVLLTAGQLFATDNYQLITVGADGKKTTYAFSKVQKIVFENNSMTVKMKSDPATTNIRSIRFLLSDNVGIKNPKGTSSVYIFPNPVKNNLKVAGTDKNAKINLIDMKGKLLQSVIARDSSADIDVSSLSPGLYLLKVGKQVIKFIKE